MGTLSSPIPGSWGNVALLGRTWASSKWRLWSEAVRCMGIWCWWVQLRQVFSHHSRCSAHSHPLLGNYFVLLVISRASHQSGVYIFKFRRYTPTKAMTRCAHVPYAPTFISKCRRRGFKLCPTTGQCGRSYRCAKRSTNSLGAVADRT